MGRSVVDLWCASLAVRNIGDWGRRISVYALSTIVVLLPPNDETIAALFSENFETDVTANWTINGGPSDETANFFFNYTTAGIPLAPNSTAIPGANRGLKLQANQFSEIFGGVSVSPTGGSFTGNYVIKFDWWSNFNGPFPVGGSGSTQLSTFGIGTSGTVAQWAGGTQDSVWFGATGDGNSTFDWRAYSNDTANEPIGGRYPENSGVYAAGTAVGSTNAANPFYSSFGNVSAPAAQVALFPQQTGTTQVGSTAMEWHEVEIEKLGSTAKWTVDSVLIATVDLSDLTLGGNNIFFGHSDVNATSSTDPNDTHLLFTLIDNISVEDLNPPHQIATLIDSGNWSSPAIWNIAVAPNNHSGAATFDAIINSGTVTLDQEVAINSLTLAGGTITGPAEYALTMNDSSTWSTGTMSGSGQTTIDPDGTLTIDGLSTEPHELSRTLVNEGSTTWTGNNHIRMNDGTFQNNGSFTADAPAGHLLQAFGIGGTNVFNNEGTFTKTGAGTAQLTTATTGVTFDNAGAVDVQDGQLNLESEVSQHVGSELNGGSWRIGPNATLQFGTGSSITTSFADVTLDGAGSVFAKINSLVDNRGAFSIVGGRNFNATGPFTNSGTVTIGSGSTFTASGGFTQTASAVLRGTGTLDGNLQNAGALRPGNSPGILEIDGDYTQSSTGVLEIEVGGLAPGTEHDLVIVRGFASIAGRLDAPIFGSYVPVLGDEVTFLTADAGREGRFGSIFSPNLASVNPNVAIDVLYDNRNNVRLKFVAPSTAIEFVTNEPESNWTGFDTWTNGEEPGSTNIITVKNDSTGPQQVNVTHGSAFVHELNVVGQTETIKLSIQNGSSFSATAGVTVDSKGVVELDQGNLISSQVQVQPGGVLTGNGTVIGNVVVGAASGEVDATLRPGLSNRELSTGHLSVQGNYEQGGGGTMAIEIDGTGAGQFDTISVEGGAKLGGMLVVDATELDTIAPGTIIPILAAGNLSANGIFEDVQTVGNNEIYFAPTYVPGVGTLRDLASGSDVVCNSGTMCVTGYFKGDMNRNGAFDPADIQSFALALTKPSEYHSAFGLFGTAPGDLDGWGTPNFSPNGRLDFDDIRGFRAVMASNGVSTTGLAAAIAALQGVPEPSAIVPALGGIVFVIGYPQRRCRIGVAR